MAKGKKTGGRKAGTPNKATAEIKDIAKQHGPAAIARLADLMMTATSEAAQVAAANSLLDRGYGKAAQPQVGADDEPPIKHTHRIERVIVRPEDKDG